MATMEHLGLLTIPPEAAAHAGLRPNLHLWEAAVLLADLFEKLS
jgi:hypothetical protein